MVLADSFYYQPLRIDTINTRVFADIVAKEGDANGRGLLVTLTENGLMKDTTGIALNLKWEHTSVGNQGLDNFEIVDLTKGQYKITYPTEMLNRGKVNAFIQILDGGKNAGSRNIEITVDRGVGDDTAIASSDSFTALAQALIDVTNLELAYAPELLAVKQQLAQISKNFTDYGGIGDGITDNSVAFKYFLSLGGNLSLAKGVYMLTADKYDMVSDTNLMFDDGAIIKLLPHDSDTYYMLNIYNIKNVRVTNAYIDGSKDKNERKTGEWGHGFNITNSENIYISNATVINTFGDGYYIGHEFHGISTQLSKKIIIDNAVVDGARRNGFSICGGKDIYINNPIVKNITETNPKAAFDFEPEGVGGVKPVLGDVTVNSPQIENCASSFELNLNNLINKNQKTTISINNSIVSDVGNVLTVRKCDGELDGLIQFNGIEATGVKLGVIYSEGYRSNNTPPIILNGLVVNGYNTSQSENDFYNHFLTVTEHDVFPTNADIGNITLINPIIYDLSSLLFRFLRIKPGNTFVVKKIRIINPIVHTEKAPTSFIRGNPDLKITDVSLDLKSLPNYYLLQLDQSLPSYVDNRNMSDWLELHSNDEYTPYGYTLTISVVKNSKILFRPTSKIIGYSTENGKGIHSIDIGSSVTLMYTEIGWIIKNMVGTWENEV